jgi:hypothetical protein
MRLMRGIRPEEGLAMDDDGGDYSSDREGVDVAVVEYANGEHGGIRAIRSRSMIIEPLDLVVECGCRQLRRRKDGSVRLRVPNKACAGEHGLP